MSSPKALESALEQKDPPRGEAHSQQTLPTGQRHHWSSCRGWEGLPGGHSPRGWQWQQQMATVGWHSRETKASNGHGSCRVNSAPCAAPAPQEMPGGDRNSQGAQNAASVPLILPELSVGGQPPQGQPCPALDQPQTLPQLPAAPGAATIPGTGTKVTEPLWTGLSLGLRRWGLQGQPETRADPSGFVTLWGQLGTHPTPRQDQGPSSAAGARWVWLLKLQSSGQRWDELSGFSCPEREEKMEIRSTLEIKGSWLSYFCSDCSLHKK